MLLTSSHVSMLLSSGVVVLFTGLLFLSGYVLQQQTVANLQTAIKPRIQPPKLESDPLEDLARGRATHNLFNFGDEALHSVQARFSRVQDTVLPWSRLAYVQLVREPSELCNSIMFLGELHRLKSPGRRVLMFPRDWALPTAENDHINVEIETSKRLLRLAARRYGVKLHPVEPLENGGDAGLLKTINSNKNKRVLISCAGKLQEPDYLASIFSLTDYNKILYLASPGLLLDSKPFDSLLGYGPEQILTATETNTLPRRLSTSMMLVKPNRMTYHHLLKTSSSQHLTGIELLQHSFPFPDYLKPEGHYFPVQALADTASIARGQSDNETFNETEYLETKAYITFSDPDIPGPEYDIPYYVRVQGMPSNSERRHLWERLYEMYRQKRMEICRLDLEAWRNDDNDRVQQRWRRRSSEFGS